MKTTENLEKKEKILISILLATFTVLSLTTGLGLVAGMLFDNSAFTSSISDGERLFNKEESIACPLIYELKSKITVAHDII